MTTNEMKTVADKEITRLDEIRKEIAETYERLREMCNEEADNAPHSNEEVKRLELYGPDEKLNRAYDENEAWFEGYEALKEAEEYARKVML